MSCCKPRLSNLFASCWNACNVNSSKLEQKHAQHAQPLSMKCLIRDHTFLMKDIKNTFHALPWRKHDSKASYGVEGKEPGKASTKVWRQGCGLCSPYDFFSLRMVSQGLLSWSLRRFPKTRCGVPEPG